MTRIEKARRAVGGFAQHQFLRIATPDSRLPSGELTTVLTRAAQFKQRPARRE